MFELDGGGGFVDFLAAGTGAFEEVFYEVRVEERGAWGQGFGVWVGEEGCGGGEVGGVDAWERRQPKDGGEDAHYG
jgi:hypothetical protein